MHNTPPSHSYFQFLLLPSAIISTACATRLSRVSSRFASPIQTQYSLRQLGDIVSNRAAAALCFFSAAASASGTATSAFATRTGLGLSIDFVLSPSAIFRAASFT